MAFGDGWETRFQRWITFQNAMRRAEEALFAAEEAAKPSAFAAGYLMPPWSLGVIRAQVRLIEWRKEWRDYGLEIKRREIEAGKM